MSLTLFRRRFRPLTEAEDEEITGGYQPENPIFLLYGFGLPETGKTGCAA
jgi:hypothetical protein